MGAVADVGPLRVARRARWLRPSLAVTTAIAAGLLTAAQPLDADLWVHLVNGRFLATEGRFPYPDPFTYSAGDAVWTMHEWLPAWLIYALTTSVGVAATAGVWAAIVSAIWLIVNRTMVGEGVSESKRAFAIAVCALPLSAFGGIRPLHVGVLCAAATAALLLRHRRTGTRAVWWLPAVFAAWANVHASFPIGLGLIAVMAAEVVWERASTRATVSLGPLSPAQTSQPVQALHGEGARAPDTRRSNARLRTLILVGAISAVAILANPAGLRLLVQPFWQATLALRRFNTDWNPPALSGLTWWAFVAAIGFAVATLVAGRLRVSPIMLAVAVVLLGMGFDARKLMAFSTVVLPMILAEPLREARLPTIRVPSAAAWVAGGTAVCAALATFVVVVPRSLDGPVVTPMPQAARAVLASLHSARVWNTYHWGAFLSWDLWPGTLTFVDGRFDPFVHGPFQTYVSIDAVAPGWDSALAAGNPDTVLVQRHSSLRDGLIAHTGWDLVYEDAVASVFRTATKEDSRAPAPRRR